MFGKGHRRALLPLILLAATMPVSARAASSLGWSAPRVIAQQPPLSNVPVEGITCPSVSLCLFHDSAGEIGVVRNPASAAPIRTAITLPGIRNLNLLDCPSSVACIAADADGHLITSTNPTGGPGAWHISSLGGGRRLAHVSCPSVALCIGTDQNGNLFTSTDPADGAIGWAMTTVTSPLESVSCASTTHCVAIDAAGHALTSTDPAGGIGAWTYSGAPPLPAGPISCPSVSLCVLGSGAGVVTSTGPAALLAWLQSIIDPGNTIATIECPSENLCLAGDAAGDLLTTTNPTGGPTAWTVQHIPGAGAINSIACPTVSLCVVADGTFRILTNATATWTSVTFPGFDGLTSLDCQSPSTCVAVDGFGDHFVTSSRPGGSWRATRVTRGIGPDPQVWRVACASRSLCLALVTSMGAPGASGAAGTLYSFSPAGAPRRFRRLAIRGAERSIGFEQVSCNDHGSCGALDFAGHLFTSATPGRAASWRRNRSGRRWFAVSCPTAGMCVALHSDPEQVVASGEPVRFAAPGGAIDVIRGRVARTVTIDASNGLTGIACPTQSSCVAVDDGGNVLSATNPLGRWRMTHVDDWSLVAIRCPSVRLCVAVDRAGRALVGRR